MSLVNNVSWLPDGDENNNELEGLTDDEDTDYSEAEVDTANCSEYSEDSEVESGPHYSSSSKKKSQVTSTRPQATQAPVKRALRSTTAGRNDAPMTLQKKTSAGGGRKLVPGRVSPKKKISPVKKSKKTAPVKKSTMASESEREYYLGKDEETRWTTQAPPSSQTTRANIFTGRRGVQGSAKSCLAPLECWEIFFPKEKLDDIVRYTNQKLDKFRAKYQRERDCTPTTDTEVRAVLGLLYLAGCLKQSHVHVKDLWADDGTAPEYFKATMRYNRFLLVLRALRFDDADTREERRKIDKFAPVREMWEHFNEVSQASYEVGENVTIDEMMAAFRGKCSFRQYLPSKPDPYGLKSFALVTHTLTIL